MKRPLAAVVLLGALAAFAFGLYHLFQLRYEAGDIYPEYSSLRADPLGTMAFYEALSRMPGLEVERDYSAQNQLPRGRGVTYLHLAASRFDWASMDEDLLREIQGYVTGGGRLVIAFLPEADLWAKPGTPVPPVSPAKSKPGKSDRENERKLKRGSPPTALGFEFSRVPLAQTETGKYRAVRVEREADLPLPDELWWHSPLVFTNLDAAWRTVYSRRGAPVLIERSLGPGTIVMASDSYFLSNEGLRKDRQSGLLAWLVGPNQRVLFDEAHLGIVEQSGVAILMHKYRLQGFAAALLLVAALFIWQNATSFPPPAPQPQIRTPVVGKEAAAGFVNLLRRNIAPARLLRVCFEEWTKSLSHTRSVPIDRIDVAQSVLESEESRGKNSRDPVRAYREISLALKGPKR